MAEVLYSETFPVEARDFAAAGTVSSKIKNKLKMLGIDGTLTRRASIISYEAEINLTIHSDGGEIALEVTPEEIHIISRDRGPGIGDISLALKEGWSTASDSIRELGFGAGMGLPNMKKNSDEFEINSVLGRGTTVSMKIFLA